MEPTTFILTSKDIAACPIHSMSVTHYYPDGSCRCVNETGQPDSVGGDEPPEDDNGAEFAVPDNMVWVEGYTRADGTDVAGYWREVG